MYFKLMKEIAAVNQRNKHRTIQSALSRRPDVAPGMSLKSTWDPAREVTREFMREVAIDSAVLTAWKEKSNSPTKLLTCLDHSVRKTQFVLRTHSKHTGGV